MKNVLEKIDLYKQALVNASGRKKLWTDLKKTLIEETLLEVQKSVDLDWSVQLLDDRSTPEAINIHFHQTPSGLIEVTSNSEKNLAKHGGASIFAQDHNGSIHVICTFPYVDKWINQQAPKFFEKVDPKLITKDFVLRQVEKFLDEMRIWEDSSSINRIGFNNA